MIPEGACVLCVGASGVPVGETLPIAYKRRSVGFVTASGPETSEVFLVGDGVTLRVLNTDIERFDPTTTGDDHSTKICNRCHVLKPVDHFQRNQTTARGRIRRRPTCNICCRGIDRRGMTAKERQAAEEHRPAKGTLFQCPICRKRSIVGVTAKIVLDHHKGIGKARSFICDSCNTGLGRFQNGKNLLRNALLYIEQHGE
ncbi:MAG: endonuclease domain-containing protein [bacterium]|nr:endonuclease domain-containing protein [bacterium]